jgi:hypothetical protein
MASRVQETGYVTISLAVRQSGLSRRAVLECVERRLVVEPLTDQDLIELRRIRRLREMGVNMPGIEIILRMRRRIQEMQAELDRQPRIGDRFPWVEPEGAWPRSLPWEPGEG